MIPSEYLTDPLKFQRLCWPDLTLYDRQVEILYSVRDNDETVVPAGNGLGKDFVAALCTLWFFCSRSPCRVITSSVDGNQLEGVLWGEMRRFIQTTKFRLPIVVNHLHLRQSLADGSIEPRSYVMGRVVKQAEGMLGHHIERMADGLPRTLAVFDEASAIANEAYETADTWAHRKLVIGNPYPCTNFFFKGVKAGDHPAPDGKRLYRKVIKIRAADSPNIRLALAEERSGKTPSNTLLVPGVVDYPTYQKRRALWDEMRQSIGLDAEFYLGMEAFLYPIAWLDRAERDAEGLKGKSRPSIGRTMGVDVAEGGDSTVWTVVDAQGIVYQLSMKTPDTSVIAGRTIQLMREQMVKPENVLFDRGGGGKQHADYLRTQGYKVRTVGFGEAATDPRALSRMKTVRERTQDKETGYVYRNRRAEMFGMLRVRLDPANATPFGIPTEYRELRRQLSLIPLKYDTEGRLFLPPKNKRSANSNEQTLTEIIGHSPDEADSLVLAVFGQFYPSTKREARVFA